ncbi:MAG: DNA adenine methylase [Actinomycetota bacterium]|nr:DNA adenine methylase [Actinomycetota bacterium]
MIKYLGSKRRLVPVLSELLTRSGAATALDLFTGTTRVAQAFKQAGAFVTAVDTARYSEILALAHVATDPKSISTDRLEGELARLNRLPGEPGYFTETFCIKSRFFQPANGERIDAIRDTIETELKGDPIYPLVLTSLIEAADRVDSTAGVQMAYMKTWAPRSYRPLELRAPQLWAGPGAARRADALDAARALAPVDLAYLDPPYNQHRYFTNYHVWETLVAWDAPEHYGVACKRIDSRDPATKSVFNQKRSIAAALRELVATVRAETLIVSYNDEAWLELAELVDLCAVREAVTVLSFDSKRYVGAQIGIHNPKGEKVGTVSHLRNLEYLVVSGPRQLVARMTAPFAAARLALPA